MTENYSAPPHMDLVYIGPSGRIDPAFRRASFNPDEAEKFDIRGAAIQFRMAKHPEHIARWVPRLASFGVTYMDTDGAIIGSLRDVVDRLDDGLFIQGPVKKSVRWIGAQSNIRFLTLYDSEIFFDETSFPKLEALKAKKDKTGKLFNYVSHHQLKHLDLSGYDYDVIEAAGDITSLQIAGAMDRHLELPPKPGITDLWLHNLRSLEDVEFVAQLPNLERLKIYYCKKVIDYSPLLKLSRLKRVEIIQQGTPNDAATFHTLAASGVQISGFTISDK